MFKRLNKRLFPLIAVLTMTFLLPACSGGGGGGGNDNGSSNWDEMKWDQDKWA